MSARDEFERQSPRRRGQGGGAALVLGLLLAAAVLATIGWFAVLRPRTLEKRAREAEEVVTHLDDRLKEQYQREHAMAELMRRQAEIAQEGETVVDDPEGNLLWSKPSSHGPLDLRYVPAGTLCLICLSGGTGKVESERDKAVAALGPWGQAMLARLEALTGAKAAEMSQALAAVIVRADGELDVSCQVELWEPWTTEELQRRFPQGKSRRIHGVDAIEQGDRVVLFVGHPMYPPGPPYGQFVVCPEDLAEAIVESADDPPMLVRDIEDLVRQSEMARAATIIVSAKFLEAAGADLFHGDGEALRDAFTRFVGRETTAVLMSAGWEKERFFLELRATPALSVSPRWLATTLHQRLVDAAGEVEQYVAGREWPEYGRRVIERYPAMLRKLSEFTRRGEDNRQAVLRAYLPAMAGHNLVMGAELLLTQGGATTPGDADHAPRGLGHATQGDAQASVEDRLAARVSLVFPRESLDRALELWSTEAGVAAAIDGPAFAAAGVTRNQSLELELRDRPAAEILLEILRRANPDRTAEDAADPRQKLVYFVEPNPAGGPGRIIVTTRAAAAEQGVALPVVFAVSGE